MGWQDKPKRKLLGKANVDHSKKIVIVGGGATGLAAAETLRDTGYNGVIYMVSKETGKGIFIQNSLMIELS